jgi:hypothetical protein
MENKLSQAAKEFSMEFSWLSKIDQFSWYMRQIYDHPG